MNKLCSLFFSIILLPTIALTQNNIEVDADFPGGNIEVVKISNDTVWLKPDLTETNGEWFYWNFRIRNISNKKITFSFMQKEVFSLYGPAYSINNDQTWKWYGENRVMDNCFDFSFSESDTIAYFATSFPYTEKNLYQFFVKLEDKDKIFIDTLCTSPEGRKIEKIIIPSLKETKAKVLFTARHHACEMMPNYIIEGIIEALLHDEYVQKLREHTEVIIIPFMDKDGVENGEQGKNRIPRDHNRDYNGISVHNSTNALRTQVESIGEGKLKFALDLHCPMLAGPGNEISFLLGNAEPEIEKNQILFSKMLEDQSSSGDCRYYHNSFVYYNTAWNKPGTFSQGMPFRKWASGIEGIQFVSTLEFPYANISGMPVSKDGVRKFGKAIARSVNDLFIENGL